MESRLGVFYYADSSDDIRSLVREAIPSAWTLDMCQPDASNDQLSRSFSMADVLITNRPLSADQVAQAPRLQLVHKMGIGYDNVDINALTNRNIALAVCPIGSPEAVAEHAVMLILAAAKRLPLITSEVRCGGWPRWSYRNEISGLMGSTVGILGFGRIGQAVAERLLAFGTVVRAFRYPQAGVHPELSRRVEFVESVDELFRNADVISVNTPLTPETFGIVDERRLLLMKRGGILVNTARGAVVVVRDLEKAILSGHIGGAGLDTLETEPPIGGSAILQCRNVTVTPHIAGGGINVLRAKMPGIVANIDGYMKGKALQWRVV